MHPALRYCAAVLLGVFASASGETANPIVSDHFTDPNLNENVWTFVNPLGDGHVSTNGARVSIAVPAGVSHNLWTDGKHAPRLMQSVADQDFEIEVKFDSDVTERFQMQGLLVEQDESRFVRVEFQFDRPRPRAYAAIVDGAGASVQANVQLQGAVAPLYLRLAREGDRWIHRYSFDGQSWQTAATFTHAMTVTAVGVYGANHRLGNQAAPAHTAVIDHFVEVMSAGGPPPDDPSYPLQVASTGQGTVVKSPDQESYAAGTVVELRAEPAPGWSFDGWGGSLSGTENPITLVMDDAHTVTATFVQGATAPTISAIGIDADVESVVVSWQTDQRTTGEVEYGTTAAYELGSATSPTLAETHAVTLSPLLPETTYHLRIVARNESGLQSASDNVTFTTPSAPEEPSYTLSVSVIGEGAVTRDPDQPSYPAGSTAELTAVPAADWAFDGWSGALSGTSNPATIEITADTAVEARFVPLAEPDDPSPIVSDVFNDPTLDQSVWTFVNPLGDGAFSTNGKQLLISVPAGLSHNLWTTGNDAPRLMQSVDDQDFEVEVKFDSSMSEAFQMQGLLIEQDESRFVRVEFHYDGSRTRVYSAVIDGAAASVKAQLRLSGVAPPMYLRLARAGSTWTHRYSFDAETWHTAAVFTHELTMTGIGVYSGNFGSGSQPAPAHTAAIDYFMNLASPIDPGPDLPLYTLGITVSGEGSVSRNPDQESYIEGAVVELTAQPSAGWTFESWAGDLAGAQNPASVVMDGDRAIEARFVAADADEHTLEVVTHGMGTVLADPPGGVYAAGTVVQLTAAPDQGWSFDRWEGDASGSGNPIEVTVDRDLLVEAHFASDGGPGPGDHALSVAVIGSGSVALSPDGGVYPSGTLVELTAEPTAGWLFAGWSGDLTGDANPETLLMSADLSVTAMFVEAGGDALLLSNIEVQPTGPTSALVTWLTNQDATSRVDYGITSSLGARRSSGAHVKAHSVAIDWLHCERAYLFRVRSVSPAGVTAESALLAFTSAECPHPGIGAAPQIDVWDGDNQIFGDRGQAQRWINILGRVSTAHPPASLSYTLNGGNPRPLSVGPTPRRLASKGDFNVEIDYAELAHGVNVVEIRAQDAQGRTTLTPVTVTRVQETPLPLPYHANWAQADVNSYAYSVDGHWAVQGDGIAANTLDYDRLLVLGDLEWTDFEVTVPVTVREFGPHAHVSQSGAPMVGLAIRWLGHTQLASEQPRQHWYPNGAFAWYIWSQERFELVGNEGAPFQRLRTGFELGVTYLFKAQAMTLDAERTTYRFKVWRADQAEPQQWHLEITDTGGPAAGAIALIAHHADVLFGNVQVTFVTSP